jgi:precorrin-8X/cobalt-precorrin-8 methylmutase
MRKKLPFDYVVDPKAIEKNSFEMIRTLTNLDGLDQSQQQVVMRIVHSVGMPEVADKVRFSANACASGQAALAAGAAILCDVEMVKQGITKRMIQQPPLCFLNDPRTVALAKSSGETRSMAALTLWGDNLAGSIVVIGNAPTALFRLLEMIEQANEKESAVEGGKEGGKDSNNKPALIIGMPVGFIGAAESKQALWDVHERLGIECITLLGNQGGSAVSSATCNALLRCNKGEIY